MTIPTSSIFARSSEYIYIYIKGAFAVLIDDYKKEAFHVDVA